MDQHIAHQRLYKVFSENFAKIKSHLLYLKKIGLFKFTTNDKIHSKLYETIIKKNISN